MCTKRSQRGLTLVELIMFIAIVSIALTGILLVTNQTSAHSADTLLRKQALSIAESWLEEIEARPFTNIAGASSVQDFNGATSSVGNYAVSVSVVPHALGSIGSASAVQITVAVLPPVGASVVLDGYRTNY